MSVPKPSTSLLSNSGVAAVQVGAAGGNVTVIHQHYHFPVQATEPAAAVLKLRVYDPSTLPRIWPPPQGKEQRN